MAVLVGILLDFSEFMKDALYEKFDKKDGKRSRSIFKIIDDLLIRENIFPENKLFAIGFGTRNGLHTIDFIGTIKQFHEKYAKSMGKPEYTENLEKVFSILENAGAKSIRRWITEGEIKKSVPYYSLALILDALEFSSEFRRKVISCLPYICKADSLAENIRESIKYVLAKNIDVGAIVTKIHEYFAEDENLVKRVLKEEAAVFDLNFAADAFRYWFEGKEVDDDKIQKVLQSIKPFLYGKNILYTALKKSINIFQKPEYKEFKKYLFVLSNGVPKDSGNIESIVQNFEKTNVKVISCFVSSMIQLDSKRLYDSEASLREFGARLMFKISSKFETEILPYMIFENMGWSIDKTTNETKLFLQVNHPDHIQEACTLAKKLASSQDALLDFLGDISLSIYTQKVKKSLEAKAQDGKTCYANAVAAVLHLAMKRILNRIGGYPDFFELRDRIIDAFGKDGARVSDVLEIFCRKYRLEYRRINAEEALKSITERRPVVSTFALTNSEWKSFSDYFEQNPTGVLTKTEIDLTKRSSFDDDSDGGHAVVLASFNSECLRLMNSWGEEWGDMGFFRVQNKEVLNLTHYEVYWTLNILQEEEKAAYDIHGATFAQKIIEKFKSIKSTTYTCPHCNISSLVRDFRGASPGAECPKCKKTFQCINKGDRITMNLYLISLLR